MRREDLSGMVFGRWTALQPMRNTGMRGTQWLCRCSCGHQQRVSTISLKHGNSKGCRACYVATKVRKHGMADTSMKEYRQWRDMRQRCNSSHHKLFPYYGGRGISICSEWDDFSKFHSDMGSCPQAMTLERIDNDANYSRDNCKWASWAEQARNKRNNNWQTSRGIRLIVADWATQLQVDPKTIMKRIKQGWTMDQVVDFYAPDLEVRI
jgi:hypothetical protein